jgi:hypothetical protein
MLCSLKRPIRSAATLAVLALVALGISPAALASYSGGPDRSDAASLAADRSSSTGSYSVGPDRSAVPHAGYELDPAIRTAIAARATQTPVALPVAKPVAEPILASDDGFAWGAAALGLAFGVVGMSLVLGCVTLVRNDGRLRNA